MPLHHPSQVGPLHRLSTQAFFGTAIPKLLEAREAHCRAVGGRYFFEIVGEGGGSWSIDFDDSSINSPKPGRVVFHLTTDTTTFETLLAGKLDMVAAIRERRVRYSGDTHALTDMATLIAA